MSFITKLKSALGNSKTQKTLPTQDTIAAIINDIEHHPFAISETDVLYAGLNELGGYYFFQSVIVGTYNIKTKKGAKLTLIGKGFTMELESDSIELESDHTDIKGRSISKIDFQIEEEDVPKITKSQLDRLIISCDQQEFNFDLYEGDEEE